MGGAFGNEDAHYFLDLDMAVLGSPPDGYAEYRERIRGEYSFLSEPMYTALRLKVRYYPIQPYSAPLSLYIAERSSRQTCQNIVKTYKSSSEISWILNIP